jgi:hypothetical protein
MRRAACFLLFGLALSCAHAAEAPVIPRFIEETDSAGLQSRFEGDNEFQTGGGVAAFDCDDDGLPEVYVTGGVNKARFYRNRSVRGGPLKLQEERSGLELTGANGAYPLDMDGDGHTDLVVLRVGEVQAFRGLGGCKFERATEKWALKQRQPAAQRVCRHLGTRPGLADGGPGHLRGPQQTRFPLGQLHARQPVASGHWRQAICGARRARTRPLRAVDAVLGLGPYRPGGPAREQRPRVLQGRAGAAVEDAAGQPPSLYGAEQGWKPLQIWGMGIASHDLDGDGKPEVFLTSMADNKLQKLEGRRSHTRLRRCGLQTWRHRPPAVCGW